MSLSETEALRYLMECVADSLDERSRAFRSTRLSGELNLDPELSAAAIAEHIRRSLRQIPAETAPTTAQHRRTLEDVGRVLDEMIHARYHNGGSALAASARWKRVHETAEEIRRIIGSSDYSPMRQRWEAWDAERDARSRKALP